MRRIPRTCSFGVVAADTERATFQQLQGYITTLLKSLSSSDKVLLSRQSNENIPIASFLFEEHRQAISSSSACPTDGRAFLFHSSCPLSGQELHRRLTSLGLVLDTEEKVLICTKCQYALKPSDAVSKHLGNRHEVSEKARHGLNAFVKQLQLPDPYRLEPRPDGCAQHANLATKSVVACEQCNYRTTSLDLAQRRLAKTHGEKSGCKAWLRDHLRRDLFLHSWTQNGSAYWIVALNEGNDLGAHLDTPQASPQ